jgi:hypothetical protein
MSVLQHTLATFVMANTADHEAEARTIAFLRILAVALRKGWNGGSDLPKDYIRSRIRLEIRSYFRKERRCRLRQGKELAQ